MQNEFFRLFIIPENEKDPSSFAKCCWTECSFSTILFISKAFYQPKLTHSYIFKGMCLNVTDPDMRAPLMTGVPHAPMLVWVCGGRACWRATPECAAPLHPSKPLCRSPALAPLWAPRLQPDGRLHLQAASQVTEQNSPWLQSHVALQAVQDENLDFRARYLDA